MPRLLDLAARAPTLSDLCDTILLGQEADYEATHARRAAPAEAVTIMTLHAAKGLEFPVVLLCGVEDGLLLLATHGTDRAEERRLFYVGLTRAREEVLLFHARTRQRHGKPQAMELSPFVRELPEQLLVATAVEMPRPAAPSAQLSLF